MTDEERQLALDKSFKPKKPIIKGNKAYCMACGLRIPFKEKSRYCYKCGWKIDWTEFYQNKQQTGL